MKHSSDLSIKIEKVEGRFGSAQRMQLLTDSVLYTLDEAFVRLERQLPAPRPVTLGAVNCYRFSENTIEQAVLLKLARTVSGLRAARILLEYGYVQEQAAIERILGEISEDVLFLVIAIWRNKVDPLHERYLDAFYQEELNETGDLVESKQKRPMMPRKKIQAYIAEFQSEALNPSDGTKLMRTITKAYSGFVHAAYPQIMEMYGGTPPRFWLSGMRGTPKIAEYGEDLWNYYYRGLLSFQQAASAFKDLQLETLLRSKTEWFQNESTQ